MPQKTERQSLMKLDTRNPRARPVLHQFSSHRQFLALTISDIKCLRCLHTEKSECQDDSSVTSHVACDDLWLPAAPLLISWYMVSVTSALSSLYLQNSLASHHNLTLCCNVICALHKHL